MKYGWIPDTPDARDLYFRVGLPIGLPQKVDMRAHCPAVYNQGSLGSCTAQSIAGALHFTQLENLTQNYIPSRLFIYYNTRVLHGTVNQDSGASLRNTIKAVAKQGYCKEARWPYKISSFKTKPSLALYREASPYKLGTLMYQRVPQSLMVMKQALYENNPIIFGFSVYDSFQSATVARTGVVPMPKSRESLLGGHAMTIVGYDDTKKHFIVRNSWGSNWGDKGYCYMPYDFLTNNNLSDDFWVIKAIAV